MIKGIGIDSVEKDRVSKIFSKYGKKFPKRILGPNEIKEMIYKINNVELLVKKNFDNSVNLITDFILSQVSNKTNS